MIRQKKNALALLLAALCLLGGCGGGEEDDTPKAKEDHVKVSDAYFGLAYYDTGKLDPVTDNTRINRLVCEAMYEGLFEVGDNFTAVPVLCSEYTGDGTSFVFTLREDATFWSGERVTAKDVVDSLMAAQENENSPYRERMRQVVSVEAQGDNKVSIELGAPNVNFPRLLDIPVRRISDANESFAEGTGPFCPVKENGKWTLTANENWHDGFLGTIRRITLVTMVRADAAVSSFQTGDVSLMREPRISSNSTAINGSVDTVQTPSANLHYIGVNFANETLKNSAVRRALSTAIGRKGLCDTQLQTFADPAVLPVNPQPLGDDALKLDMSGSSDSAAALLAEAKLESAPSFTLLVNSDNSFKVAAAEQIAASWKAAGISVTVDKRPYDEYVAALQAGSFDLYYGTARLMPDFDLRPLISSGGALNFGGYSSDTMMQALTNFRSGQDLTGLYQLFVQEMPIIPIAFERDQVVIRKGLIKNFTPEPYNAFANLETWEESE